MQDQAFVKLMEMSRIKVVHECRNWIPNHSLEALLCLRRRVNALSPELNRKDPFSIRMFEEALDRVHAYINYLDVHKTKWIGLRLHFPILWFLLVDGEDNEFWKIVTQ